MQVTFLGTGASEGIPSMHCSCEVCENARRVGGKEIRTRAGVLINDDLLIDFCPDSFLNAIRYQINYRKVKNILVTHSHSDHLCLEDFQPRLLPDTGKPFAPLHVYSNASVVEKLQKVTSNENVKLHEVFFEETYFIGAYQVIPLRAVHMGTENCMMFLIEKDDKRYLHLSDTTIFGEGVFHCLKKKGLVVDAVALDTTYGLLDREFFGHMNLKQVASVCDKFRALGIFTDKTQIYATHVCHWGGSHEALKKEAEKYGIHVAYDGLKIQL